MALYIDKEVFVFVLGVPGGFDHVNLGDAVVKGAFDLKTSVRQTVGDRASHVFCLHESEEAGGAPLACQLALMT